MEVREAIGPLVISNVRKHNAMSRSMWLAFSSGIMALDENPAVRVIVVRGDGDSAFMSGADIGEFKNQRTSLSRGTTGLPGKATARVHRAVISFLESPFLTRHRH